LGGQKKRNRGKVKTKGTSRFTKRKAQKLNQGKEKVFLGQWPQHIKEKMKGKKHPIRGGQNTIRWGVGGFGCGGGVWCGWGLVGGF